MGVGLVSSFHSSLSATSASSLTTSSGLGFGLGDRLTTAFPAFYKETTPHRGYFKLFGYIKPIYTIKMHLRLYLKSALMWKANVTTCKRLFMKIWWCDCLILYLFWLRFISKGRPSYVARWHWFRLHLHPFVFITFHDQRRFGGCSGLTCLLLRGHVWTTVAEASSQRKSLHILIS